MEHLFGVSGPSSAGNAASRHACLIGETIPIRLFLGGFDLTPTFRDVNKKFSTRYYLNLVLIDEENRRYFKQQVSRLFLIQSGAKNRGLRYRRLQYSGYRR